MGCCDIVFKWVLIILNAIFLLAGLAPLILGSIALADPETLKKLLSFLPKNIDEVVNLNELAQNFAVVFIVFGCVVVMIALLGFFGACCKIKCLLYLYLTAILVIIAGEITLLVIALAYPATFSDGGQKVLRMTFKEGSVHDGNATIEGNRHTIDLDNDAVSLGWNSMQYGLYCCGPSGFNDYNINSTEFIYRRNQAALAPITCCKHIGRDIPVNSTTELSEEVRRCYLYGNVTEDYNQMGCFDAMVHEATSSAIFIAVMACIGVLELLLIVATMALACKEN